MKSVTGGHLYDNAYPSSWMEIDENCDLQSTFLTISCILNYFNTIILFRKEIIRVVIFLAM